MQDKSVDVRKHALRLLPKMDSVTPLSNAIYEAALKSFSETESTVEVSVTKGFSQRTWHCPAGDVVPLAPSYFSASF